MKKIGSRQIAIHKPEKLISDAFIYLAENDIDLAFDMLSCFDEATIKTESFQRISEILYFKVMNVHELIKIYESKKDEYKTFDQKINYIILLKYNLQFAKAKEEAEKMLDSYQKEDKDCQIKYLELLSELCLFTDEMDKSVEYIPYRSKSLYPYHQSSLAFISCKQRIKRLLPLPLCTCYQSRSTIKRTKTVRAQKS